jgi:hypothetical protein
MRKFGVPNSEMKKVISEKDLFLPRLHLLVIMSKAYLQGMPVGDYRKKAIIDNAHHLFYQSLHMISDYEQEAELKNKEDDTECKEEMSPEHIFHQRVQLLSVMTKAFAEGRLIGEFKVKALKENLEFISNTITFSDKVGNMEFLKVA